jgi:hypothetical protein
MVSVTDPYGRILVLWIEMHISCIYKFIICKCGFFLEQTASFLMWMKKNVSHVK